MDLAFETLPSGALCIALNGRLDITGASAVELRFTALAAGHASVVVDMQGVEFMASMGLRLLVMAARKAASKGGRLVLWRPQPVVAEVITTSGLEALLPMVAELSEAEARVLA
ncbi:MAG TPA: STAS domain-containing protein [Roseococcus sp.]|nr:STAS domain-containing protein [Roseococcus sp.]